MSGDHDQRKTMGTREAVLACTAALSTAGRAHVPFGATHPADEAAFLTAMESLLTELDVQLAARRLMSGASLLEVRTEVAALRDRLGKAAETCDCGHAVGQHRTTGCNWENEFGTEHCGCTELISGLAPVQIRSYLEPTTPRRTV